ncbi:hypothetical protein [Butyrivibrio sp. AD3002]|uniref:hypothetical protein n=1 Tax=Butyrivibrio sp. AD3002 TaxID=1280670 RepID=UPI0003B4EC70|nr:hypothetical protein [Butyrivibrio sp. AD3002]
MYRKKLKSLAGIALFMLSALIFTGSAKVNAAGMQEKNIEKAIPGNGKHFVQYNGHIYFRIPSEDAMKLSAIWGDYEDIEEDSTGSIVAMDTDTLETEILFEDMSRGPIVISGDRMILSTNQTSGNDNVYSVAFDGSDSEDLPGTYIYGTQPSGKYFVTGGFGSKDHKLHFYICDEDGDYKEAVSSNRLYDYAGLGESQLFCVTREDEDSGSLSGFDLVTGEETVYGKLPEVLEKQTASCVVRRIGEENGYIYLRLSAYKGSTNIYAGSKYVRVKCGEADSLEEVTPSGTASNNERFASPVMVKNGELIYVEGTPNTAALDAEGYVGFYDEDGIFTKVASGYETASDDETDTRMAAGVIEAVDGYIYVIQNKECRVPEDDDKLRYAYKRLETWFIRIDEKTGESETIYHCVNPEVNESDSDHSEETEKKDISDRDPLEGLVREDILKRFRKSNPYRTGNGTAEEARRLGFWVKDSIKVQMPERLKEHGEEIGQKYEFYFGTDIGNNLENNFPHIYEAYFTLKDYIYNGGNVEFYNSLIESNAYLGDGKTETIYQMYKDLQKFITECNNVIRRK